MGDPTRPSRALGTREGTVSPATKERATSRAKAGIGTVLALAAITLGAISVGLLRSPVSAAPGDEITFRMDGVVDSTEGLGGSISVGDPVQHRLHLRPDRGGQLVSSRAACG